MGCCGSGGRRDFGARANELPGERYRKNLAKACTTVVPFKLDPIAYPNNQDIGKGLDDRPRKREFFNGLTVAEVMRDEVQIRGKQVAVLVIDMQYEESLHERWGNRTVGENQIEVLDEANRLGLPIFEIRVGDEGKEAPTVGDLLEHFPDDERHILVNKPSHSSFAGTNLAEELQERGIQTAIVVGFHADVCVKSTIFGAVGLNPPETYEDGLLDRGISVITSRAVLASNSSSTIDHKYLY